MNRIIVETTRRWRLPLTCYAWMFTFLGLLTRGRYETFLAADFLPVIILATVILLPLSVFSLLRRRTPRFGARELLGTAVILLPLVYIHHSGGATLGAGAFATRYVGMGVVPGKAGSIVPESADNETSLLDLFMNSEKYSGREITVTGMLAKDTPQVEQILGVRRPVLFRFAISCCAADATPLALVLEDGDADALKDDDWIAVSGTFRVRSVKGFDLAVLEKASIRAVPPPEQPYLYSQWGLF